MEARAGQSTYPVQSHILTSGDPPRHDHRNILPGSRRRLMAQQSSLPYLIDAPKTPASEFETPTLIQSHFTDKH